MGIGFTEVMVFTFEPQNPAATVNLSPTAASQSVQFNDTSSDARPRKRNVRVYNAASAKVFISFGGSTISATTTASMPIPAGAVEIFSGVSATYVALIATGTLTGKTYFTPGEGS